MGLFAAPNHGMDQGPPGLRRSRDESHVALTRGLPPSPACSRRVPGVMYRAGCLVAVGSILLYRCFPAPAYTTCTGERGFSTLWYRVVLEWEESTASEGVVQKRWLGAGELMSEIAGRAFKVLEEHQAKLIEEGHRQGSSLNYWLRVYAWNSYEDYKNSASGKPTLTPLTLGLRPPGPYSGSF